MKRYDTYKDSGVQWLGEIPGHWGCVRMKYLVSFINGYAFDSKKFLNEGEVAVYRISDIQNDCISSDNCVYVSHDDKFSDFEILFSERNTDNGDAKKYSENEFE